MAFVGAWTLLMSITTVLSGSMSDAFGLRKTFFLGVGLCIVSRAVMAFVTIKWVALSCGLFPLAVGEALTGPVAVASIRRYSNTKQRSISFSFFYMTINGGLLIGSLLFDLVRKVLGGKNRPEGRPPRARKTFDRASADPPGHSQGHRP